MDLLCPSNPSGLFTLVAVVAAIVLSGGGVYWFMRNKPAEVDALRAQLRDLDDKVRERVGR